MPTAPIGYLSYEVTVKSDPHWVRAPATGRPMSGPMPPRRMHCGWRPMSATARTGRTDRIRPARWKTNKTGGSAADAALHIRAAWQGKKIMEERQETCQPRRLRAALAGLRCPRNAATPAAPRSMPGTPLWLPGVILEASGETAYQARPLCGIRYL